MNPKDLTIDIALEHMRELQEKGEAKLIPFAGEMDCIAVVGGKYFYVKNVDHYRYLGQPNVKEDTQHKGTYDRWHLHD
jgi:hypothetical protein